MATEVACGWAGAIFEVTRLFAQEKCGQTIKIIKKSTVYVRSSRFVGGSRTPIKIVVDGVVINQFG